MSLRERKKRRDVHVWDKKARKRMKEKHQKRSWECSKKPFFCQKWGKFVSDGIWFFRIIETIQKLNLIWNKLLNRIKKLSKNLNRLPFGSKSIETFKTWTDWKQNVIIAELAHLYNNCSIFMFQFPFAFNSFPSFCYKLLLLTPSHAAQEGIVTLPARGRERKRNKENIKLQIMHHDEN